MNLPRLLVISDARSAKGPVAQVLLAAIDHGARGIVIRDRWMSDAERVELIAAVRRTGVLTIVAGGFGQAAHLARDEPMRSPRPELVGRSCHDADEVDRAAAEGCDYVFVSPVYPTASKPGYGPALGPAGLAALVHPGLPTYALGGVRPENVAECLAAGAYGVAIMGPVMRDPSIVVDYLKELPV
jgi:thiamine-phosphate pyrophosphorylase